MKIGKIQRFLEGTQRIRFDLFRYLPAKIVDAVKADKNKIYALDLISGGGVVYIIENMQSGEMVQGIEESLVDIGVKSKRLSSLTSPCQLRE